MDDDFDEYYRVADLHSKKPMYIPEKSELLNYADDDYFEKTPQSNALTEFFHNKMGMDMERAQELTEECQICIACAFIPIESPMEAVFNDFERMKIKFTKMQLDEFRRLLCGLINNTRLPCNRGFTPNELANRFGMGQINSVAAVSAANRDIGLTFREIGLAAVQSTFVREGEKIGRNDPCPCGSGKKYKKCCGR